jgi:hypothetical protein
VLTRTRANLGLPIPDPGELIDATSLVAGSGPAKPSGEAVAGVVVTLGESTHPQLSGLSIILEHGGVEVELLSGLSGADLSALVLSDTAADPVATGSAPYTGSYRPGAPLSAFQGTDREGLWRLKVRDGTPGNAGTLNAWGLSVSLGPATSVEDRETFPRRLSLEQNYPNPFSPSTTIAFVLPEAQSVRLEVYDLLGRRVARILDGALSAGAHQRVFDASSLSSGIYIYRLSAGAALLTRRMMVVK